MDAGISNYLLTQGVLGIAVLVEGIIIIYQQKKLDKKDTDHAEEIRRLNAALLTEVKDHATDYKEMAKREQEVLADVSQNMELFGEKIQIAKERR